MKTILSTLMAILIGSTVVVGGADLSVEDILNTTKTVVNQTNIHQLRTALELYYADQGKYPDSQNGKELVEDLEQGGYINVTSEPVDASLFSYKVDEHGQDYSLSLGS